MQKYCLHCESPIDPESHYHTLTLWSPRHRSLRKPKGQYVLVQLHHSCREEPLLGLGLQDLYHRIHTHGDDRWDPIEDLSPWMGSLPILETETVTIRRRDDAPQLKLPEPVEPDPINSYVPGIEDLVKFT